MFQAGQCLQKVITILYFQNVKYVQQFDAAAYCDVDKYSKR